MAGALALTVAAAVWRAPECNWDLGLFAVLLAFSVFSDLTAVPTESQRQDLRQLPGAGRGDGLPRRHAGGADRGPVTIIVGWLRWRDEWHYLLNNLLTYAVFPLVGGIAFHEVVDATGINPSEPTFYVLVFGVFLAALAINFLMIAAYACYVERSSFLEKVRTALIPVLPSEFASAMLAVGVAFIYHVIGLAGDRPLRRRPGHLPVPARRAAALPAAGPRARAAQQAAGQLPGRDVERAAAHARPAGPDDRPPQRRRGPLLAGDRPAGRLLAPGRGAGPHRRAAARHRQVHPSRPHPQGQRAAHRRGLDADQAPPPAGRARRLLAGRLRAGRRDHPRPPRADRRQRLSARPRRRRHPRSWRGSSPSPTPTT